MEQPSTRGNKVAALGACVLLVSLATRSAHADVPSESDAEALFVQAKALMVQGNDAEACPRLQESQRIDPGTGTLLLLALCHERIGKTASAWSEYREALASAQREKRTDREELAKRHIAILEPHLTRARLRVADGNATLPRFEIRRDGETMSPAAWSLPTPLDPGSHVFQAFMMGQERWSQSVIVSEPGDQEIFVPALHAPVLPPPPVAVQPPLRTREAPTASHAEASHKSGALRAAGFTAATVAVAGIAVGAIFGIRAIGKSHDAQQLCPAYPCSAGAQDANDAARSAATISNIAFAGGGAGLLGAFTFFMLDTGSASASPDHGQAANGARREARQRAITLGWQGQW